jgi:hypothetical protein
MGGLTNRFRYALANPFRDDRAIDPMRELADLLREVGLEPEASGGAVTFRVSSTLRRAHPVDLQGYRGGPLRGMFSTSAQLSRTNEA